MKITISKPVISVDEINAVEQVLSSGYLAYGPRAREFEKLFAEYIGVEHAISIVNGTAALHTALLALGIGEGDEVITTPFSFVASSNAILYVGAKPVFVDIDPATYNIDPDRVVEKINDKTKAILVVHLYGQPCEMKALREIADDHGLFLVEDASQAHGAEYRGVKVGSIGDIATFSFYATKNMTTGEGGMITTNSEELSKKIRLIINHGQSTKYTHVVLGYNYRLTDIQASIGIQQLKKLDRLNEMRIRNAKFYDKKLSKLSGVETPFAPGYVKHVYHQYVLWVEERDGLKSFLENKGIQTAIHYPMPIYKQPLYRELGYEIHLENAEKASNHVLSIPVHPLLTEEDLNKVVDMIYEYYEER